MHLYPAKAYVILVFMAAFWYGKHNLRNTPLRKALARGPVTATLLTVSSLRVETLTGCHATLITILHIFGFSTKVAIFAFAKRKLPSKRAKRS